MRGDNPNPARPRRAISCAKPSYLILRFVESIDALTVGFRPFPQTTPTLGHPPALRKKSGIHTEGQGRLT